MRPPRLCVWISFSYISKTKTARAKSAPFHFPFSNSASLRLFLLLPLGVQPVHVIIKLRLLLRRQERSHLVSRLHAYKVHIRLALIPDTPDFRLRVQDDCAGFIGLLLVQPDLLRHFRYFLGHPLRIRQRRHPRRRITPPRHVVPEHAAGRRSQQEHQRQPDCRFLSHCGIHGLTSISVLNPSSYQVGTTEESNTMSPPLPFGLVASRLRS